jgi:DNA-binding transcriptional ArsR family regulator
VPERTLQIAILGDNENAVSIGLRNFPTHKLILITPSQTVDKANKLATKLHEIHSPTIEIVKTKDDTLASILGTITQTIQQNAQSFQEVLINVGSANRNQVIAGIAAAYLSGVRVFDITSEDPVIVPVLKLSYREMVSGAKLEILRTLEKVGQVNSLEELARATNYGKPLLSYHIRGTEQTRGLLSLGLVEVKHLKQGRLQVKLTPLARTLLSTTFADPL